MNLIQRTLLALTCLFLLVTMPCQFALAEFAHPGVVHSAESIEFVKAKIAASEEPWTGNWKRLKRSDSSDLDYRPSPHANVERGPYNNPDIGSGEFSRDGMAAYCHALCWTISGDEEHAEKATEILDAWSAKLESIGNHDAALLVGMSGLHYCIAAELMKHTWTDWPEEKQNQFATMLREIWYPIIKDFYPTANGNWDASMIQTMMAMAVFMDDQEMFDRAKNHFLTGKGNGAIGMYFKESGQCQESGRDQAHTQMGLEFLANSCETAWLQEVDLYGALDNRLLKGFEYTAKYNLGNDDVPYEPYESFKGRYNYEKISRSARGRLRPMYERVYNHYHNRQELEAPFTRQAADEQRSQRRRRDRAKTYIDVLMYSQ